MTSLPNLLAIDSSGNNCTIAIQFYSNNHKIIKSIKLDTDNKQSVTIISKLDELLNCHDLTDMGFLNIKDSIDALVLSSGPGRFTGLRIAASVIQSLAYGYNKKVISINSLKLLAQQFLFTELLEKNMSDLPLSGSNSTSIWVCQKAYNNTYYQKEFIIDNNIVYLKNNNTITISQVDLVNYYNNLNQSGKYYLIGNGWDELFYSNPIYQIKLSNNHNIFNISADARYIFDLANIEYLANNLKEYYDAVPEYEVNPYSKSKS